MERCLASSVAKAMGDKCEAVVSKGTPEAHLTSLKRSASRSVLRPFEAKAHSLAIRFVRCQPCSRSASQARQRSKVRTEPGGESLPALAAFPAFIRLQPLSLVLFSRFHRIARLAQR
jgi:hypothetical protein